MSCGRTQEKYPIDDCIPVNTNTMQSPIKINISSVVKGYLEIRFLMVELRGMDVVIVQVVMKDIEHQMQMD